MATSYIRKNRGRYLVRVHLPKDLQTGKGKSALEKYLGTGNHDDARRKAPAAVAELQVRIDRMRERRPPTPQELHAVKVGEMHRLHSILADDPMDTDGAKFDPMLWALEGFDGESLDTELLHPQAVETLRKIGAEVTPGSIEAVAAALANAAFEVQARWRKGLPLPAIPDTPKRRATATGDSSIRILGERWLGERTALNAQTRAQMGATFRLFQDHVGATPLDEV